jgi:high-affinity Fe2+/Pb2+ permease
MTAPVFVDRPWSRVVMPAAAGGAIFGGLVGFALTYLAEWLGFELPAESRWLWAGIGAVLGIIQAASHAAVSHHRRKLEAIHGVHHDHE